MPDSPRKRLEALLTPLLPGLYRAALRLAGNPADAEDLVQDACTIACGKHSELETRDHPDRWLMRILHNRFIDGARRRKRASVLPLASVTEAPALAAAELGPEDLADQADGERAFAVAWSKLEAGQRALLALRAEGYGLSEIEEITGIGREVLRFRLHRARRSLAKHLDNQRDAATAPIRLRSGQ